jgi:hypothetical protein
MQQGLRSPRAVARFAGQAVLVAALASCAGTPGSASPGTPGRGAQQPAGPGEAPATALALLASCPEEARPGGAEPVHLGTYDGVSVFAHPGRADAIVAVGKLHPDGPDECSIQHVAAQTPPVEGSFWPGAGSVQAVLLGPEECHPAFCPATVLIRDHERALGALFWREACDQALTPARLRWFAGQDSLQLTCHQSTGAAHRELVVILHVLQAGATARIAPVLALDTGTAEHASLAERETPGFCERRPVGWVRLVEQGERPLIRVFDPARGQQEDDGAGTGLLADFRFDPGTGRFEQVTPGTLQGYDARAWCRQE